MTATYRFLVEDVLAQRYLGDLRLNGASYEEYARRPGLISGHLALADADRNVDLLDPGRRALYVMRNGKIEHGGPMWVCDVPLGADSVDVEADGWLGYWDRRSIRIDRQFPAVETDPDVDQFTIFSTLIIDAQDNTNPVNGTGADLGITVVFDAPSGVLRRRRDEYRDFVGKNLGDALRELATLEDGFDYAMEYTLTAGQIVKTIRLFYPRRGVDHSNEPGFEYRRGRQGNVLRRGLRRDASTMAWRMRGWGVGADESRLRSDQINEAQRGVYPFMDGESNTDDVDQGTLDDNTAAAAATTDHAVVLPATEVNADISPRWGSYGIGDIYRVKIDDGYASADGAHRITGYKMDCATDRPTLFWEEV